MAVERTLSIIKPDAVAKKVAGEIIARIEKSGLDIIAMKRLELDKELAQGFYAVHKERPFFGELVEFMTSGPVVALVLEGEGRLAGRVELAAGRGRPAPDARGRAHGDGDAAAGPGFRGRRSETGRSRRQGRDCHRCRCRTRPRVCPGTGQEASPKPHEQCHINYK